MPLKDLFEKDSSTVSARAYNIAGIETIVQGLDELAPGTQSLACIWLLHPRLDSKETMAPLAAHILRGWNDEIKRGIAGSDPMGLITVSFDQRNHGGRLVTKSANETWRDGNATHAQDMFSTYHGTATDVSLLMTYLPSYIQMALPIETNLVFGVSLGGHASWISILHEPRITAAIIVVGCPDYASLMMHRASKSRLQTWSSSEPPGSRFIGSKSFPAELVSAISQLDPAALLLPSSRLHRAHHIKKINLESLSGKRILSLSGGADKLVPYASSEPFLTFLGDAPNVHLVNRVFPDIGHSMSPEMLKEALEFVSETLRPSEKVKHRL